MQSPTEVRHCAHLSKSFESSEKQTLSGCRFPAASFRLKRQGKAMNTGLYLAQSYQDAWSDYQRSVRNASFPVWDYVVLTASNAHQAEGFQAQLDARRAFLPARTRFLVLPDEGGVRVGSGGATLSVLKAIREREPSFAGQRILVIHSGGDSKRIPQYSAVGKLFSPVPHLLPDGRPSTLFDEFMIAMSAVPGRIREGMLLLSGDVLLLFNPLLIDYPGHGAAAISFKEKVETGKDHGVFLRGEDGTVRTFLHKQSEETLRAAGAVNENGAVDIDTGAVIFGSDMLESLYSLISTGGVFDSEKYRALVNSKVRLSLYGDFQYPLASDSTLEQFYREKPEGDYTDELLSARKAVWQALRPYRMKLLRLAPAKFIHFGTTQEVLRLMDEETPQYSHLGWSRCVACSMEESAGYNSVVSPRAEVGEHCYFEVSYVHGGAKIGEGSILSCLEIHAGDVVPPHTVLHGLKQTDGRFVCRIYGVADNPKDSLFFGKPLEGDLWEEGEEHTLWNARLYPVCDTIREAVAWALKLPEMAAAGIWPEEWKACTRKSLCSGFNDADPQAILSWEARMHQLVEMNALSAMVERKVPAREGRLTAPLTQIQQNWLDSHLQRADISEEMRLHWYVGTALGTAEGEKEAAEAFSCLGRAILRETLSGLQVSEEARITKDEHSVSLPLRVNWGGGWSDTPPYCNENGGTVLNAAILLNGERPVKVTLKRLDEPKIVFDSRDMDVHGEFTAIEPLQRVGDPFDAFVLQKAALLACGVIPASGGSLEEVLSRLGGGFRMESEVTGVPKGSGLGTSSILAAACVKALFEFLGISHTEDDLYSHVLCMEQIMSTGGGWQDQVGGVTDGIKYISSRPGFRQELRVEHVELEEETLHELNERFALIYTGQRRLARNLLRDVVGRYLGSEPDALFALNEIQRKAALMRFELERGNIDAFAALLNEHWELSKQIDSGSTNTLIDQIFDSVDDLIAGRMVCGAGGGGFLQVVLKRGVSRGELQARLKSVFQDTDINVWSCTIL